MAKRLLLFVAAVISALPQTSQQHHPPRSAEEYARILNDPKRDVWQRPGDVVAALGLGSSEIVADIGAGAGYFARRFASYAEKVYAVDIDESLLKLAALGAPKNLEIVLAAPDDPKLPEASVDTVFFCDVLHHLSSRVEYLNRVTRALRPGGRIVVIDFFKKPLPVGPPVAMKLSEEEVVAEFRAAGYTRTRSFRFLPYQYFLIFNR